MRGLVPVALVSSLTLAGAALAQPQTERAALSLGFDAVDVAVSDDDRLVAALGDGGSLAVIDTADFDGAPLDLPACAGSSLAFGRVDDTPRFYVGCGDGTVDEFVLDSATIPVTLADSYSLTVGTEAVSHVGVSAGDGRLFAVEETADAGTLHVVELDTGALDELSGFPVTLLYGAEAMTVTPLGTYVAIAHDQGRVTKVYNSGVGYTVATFALLGLGGFRAIDSVDEGYVYLLESSGSLVQYWLTGDTSYLTMTYGLDAPTAFDIVDTGDTSYFYVLDDDGGLALIPFTGGDPEIELSLSRASAGGIDHASDTDGHVYVGGAEGELLVVGAAPWVQIQSVSPESLSGDGEVTLTFVVDEDCSYDIYLGGDIDRSGTHLTDLDGSADAGEAATVSVPASLLEEGDNRLWVFATAGGFVGRDSATVYLDTPPDRVGDFELGFGDGKLIARWRASDETDIDHYDVYFADVWFDEASGAPEFSVEGVGVVHSSPAEAEAGDPGAEVSYTLEGLTNGVEYCVAVVPFDAGGQQGPWSETLCDRPEQTVGAGDSLGYCGSCAPANDPGAGSPALVALIGLGIALALRRRSPRR